MENLGKADVNVELYNYLPGVNKNRTIHNFDITAHSWDIIQNSPYFTPLLMENVVDPLGAFSAIFPSRRKRWINNYITDSNGYPLTIPDYGTPYILWKPVDNLDNSGIVKDLVERGDFEDYVLVYPGNYPSDGSYVGPKWVDSSRDREPDPDDSTTIYKWLSWVGLATPIPASDTEDGESSSEEEVETLPQTFYINQTEVRDGLWWGIESVDFLNENMPFWVTIKRENTPTTQDHETAIVISLGIDDDNNAFDLYLSSNKKPRLIDYYKGRDYIAQGTTSAPSNEKEFDTDLSKMIESDMDLEIGFMTIGGRLVIWVNKTVLTYTRVVKDSNADSSGKIAEAKIGAGKIRIWGTNTQMIINVSPMVFAERGIMPLPIPTIPPTIDPETQTTIAAPPYRNILNNGDIGTNSTALLPNDPDNPQPLYGIDASQFIQRDPGGSVVTDTPSGFGFHRQGYVWLSSSGLFGLVNISSSEFYVMSMKPIDVSVTFGVVEWTIPNAGTPYFFRLKGGAKTIPTTFELMATDVTEDILSISQTNQAPDFFSSIGSADITLYNKGGKYDYLKSEQFGISIKLGWNKDLVELEKVFTGLTISANSSEVAGKEVINVHCEDYTYILKNTLIINSPFYDGMVMYYVVKDLVNRVGIDSVTNDWENPTDYFLPSGYAFTKPAIRFDSNMNIFECIMNVVKRAEAFIYFDEYGSCHVKKLPGGLFSVGASENIVATFTRDPAGPNTILDERNIEYNLDSTVNRISIFTLDRDTRNAIVYTKSASGQEDKLKFTKVALINQPAYGAYEVAVAYGDELALRLFNSIRKTSFRTIGEVIAAKPLDFIELDGEEFRLMSISRKYDAESNSLTTDYNAEWLGG